MVRGLTNSTEIDTLAGTMSTASNLLSAAGEHWVDARRCRDSLVNLTAATVRWLINLRSSLTLSRARIATDGGPHSDSFSHAPTAVENTVTDHHCPQQQQLFAGSAERLDGRPFTSTLPWVDTYINGEDLATLFRVPNPLTADPSLTMEGMFNDYQSLFDFYQGNEFRM